MKKSILVMLMAVMIVPPCLAQELEPKGMFSIEGTQWRASYIFPPSAWTITTEMGFSGGGSIYVLR